LRLRFEASPTGWRQRIAPAGVPLPFTVIDLSRLVAPATAIESASAALQASLDLTAGPILRLAYFDLGPTQPARLLVAIHHLAIDGVSWRILLEDLEMACDQMERGELVRLLSPAVSFQSWASHLAGTNPERAEPIQAPPLPFDGPAPHAIDLRRSTRRITKSLDEPETEILLRQAPVRLQSRVEELLLAAVAAACRRWTGSAALAIDVEGHGRDAVDDLDVSRTVGWFTTITPVLINLPAVTPEAGALGAVPEIRRQMQAVSRRGASPAGSFLFNYFGQLDAALLPDSRFSSAPESPEENVSPRNRRSHPLQLDAAVAGGRLHLNWSYSAELHRQETIERLAQNCQEELRRLLGG